MSKPIYKWNSSRFKMNYKKLFSVSASTLSQFLLFSKFKEIRLFDTKNYSESTYLKFVCEQTFSIMKYCRKTTLHALVMNIYIHVMLYCRITTTSLQVYINRLTNESQLQNSYYLIQFCVF